MYISLEMLIIAIVFGFFVYVSLKLVGWIKIMNGDGEPDDHTAWRVGDLKRWLDRLPDDMPIVILDTSTDDPDNANYVLTNENVDVDDYYIFDSDEHEIGEPSGQALFLMFENKLNDDPISNYPIINKHVGDGSN